MAKKSKNRYELKEKLGEGGMGVVWKAHDTVLKTDVALKMLLDLADPSAIKAFYDECNRQTGLVHPNIVEIRDVGSFEDDNGSQPYLVMPLLRGKTLGDLMRASRNPLSVERCIDIFTQACRGLQAAHDYGLLHRDIKPNNIFILEDDSVKIIDFGVAHQLDVTCTVGRKGTLLYMSPEQLMLKPLSRASDVFSLAVLCYEALTGKHPFACSSEAAIADAIQHVNPPSASSLNVEVNRTLSQVLHKGMAKQSLHRFSSAKEFGDLLRRAFYDASFTVFDPEKFGPRFQKAAEAFQAGDLGFAQEMVNELESEGYLSTELEKLAENVNTAVRKRDIDQLLESSRARVQDGEYRLALQRVNEALEIDDRHPDAIALKHDIESQRAEADVVEWLRVGRQHLEKFSFSHARQAAQRILELNPSEDRALQFLTQVERKRFEFQEILEQKNEIYNAALDAEKQNDITAALSKMKHVLELDKQAPEILEPGRSAAYQSLYNKLRAEHEAIRVSYNAAREALDSGDYASAAKMCEQFLEKYPQHTLFKALKFDNDQKWRRAISTQIIEVEEEADREPDLDRRVEMLEGVVQKKPDIAEFAKLLEAARDKRDLVNGIVNRARELSDRRQFGEALVQWETLQTIHPAFVGLNFEIDNAQRRRQFAERVAQKKQWITQIDRAGEERYLEESLRLLSLAKEDFPQDAEFEEIEKAVRQQQQTAADAEELVRCGQALLADGSFSEGLGKLRLAHEIGSKVSPAKAELVEGLLRAARACQEDQKQAVGFLEEILNLEPGNHAASGMLRFLDDQQEQKAVDDSIFQARQLRTNNDYAGAAKLLENAIRSYPKNVRLEEFHREIEQGRSEVRSHDLAVVRRKRLEADHASDPPTVYRERGAVRRIVERYKGDDEFQEESRLLDARWQDLTSSAPATGRVVEAAEAGVPASSTSPPANGNQSTHRDRSASTKVWFWLAAFTSFLLLIAVGRTALRGRPHLTTARAMLRPASQQTGESPKGPKDVEKIAQVSLDQHSPISTPEISDPNAKREVKSASAPVLPVASNQPSQTPTRLQRLAVLNLHTAPGAEIFVDGKLSGTSDVNGVFTLSGVATGTRKVEVHCNGTIATADVVLGSGDGTNPVTNIKLDRKPTRVALVLNPPDSNVTVSRPNRQIVPVAGTRFELPAGQYRFTARASHFEERSEIVNVPGEGSLRVDLTLSLARVLSFESVVPASDAESSWTVDKQRGVIIHKTTGFGLLSIQPRYGTYSFTAPLGTPHLLGKGKLEWVAGFVDMRNYLLFSIDRDGFESYIVRNGQKQPHGAKISLPKVSLYSIAVQIRPGRIVTSVYDGDTWKRVEDWADPPPNANTGKFGFKDEITIYHFTFSKET